jgi:SWI/SNF-related matrix-associated actin-dependent regulator 1 of chromatin subfamily A
MNQPTTPYPFQAKGVRKIIVCQGTTLLADEMGLGKSPQALWAMQKLSPAGRAVVIVCPASLKENWRREVRKHLGRRATVLHHLRPPRGWAPAGPGGIYIIGYDCLARAVARRSTGWVPGSWGPALADLRPAMVIVDECQMIANPTALRSRATKRLARPCPRRLALGGTGGLNHRPIELWNTLNMLWPQRFGSRFAFAKEFCELKKNPYGFWDYSGASHLDRLHQQLTDLGMVRRRKEDVLTELPAKTRVIITLTLPTAAQGLYTKAAEQARTFLAQAEKRLPGLTDARERRDLLTEVRHRLWGVKARVGRLKLPQVIHWVGDFLSSGEKLLLFGIHHNVLRPLHRHFDRLAVLVDGDVTGAERQAAFDQFNANPAVRLLVGHIDAAGLGWSCSSASNVAFAELAWGPAQHEQAEERVRGLGRGTGLPVTAHYLIAQDTVEERLCRALTRKSGHLGAVLDGRPAPSVNLTTVLKRALLAG